MLCSLQAANHLDHDDDDEEDETPLEGFTTAIDDENTDEYAVFKNVLQSKFLVLH